MQLIWDALALPARWRYRHIPGPAFRPFVGNIPDVVRHGGHHAYWEECVKKYGRVFKVGTITRCCVYCPSASK